MEPRVEALRVAERREVAPGPDQRLLRRVLGSMRVAQDPVREPVAAVDAVGRQGRERLLVAAHRPLHQPDAHRDPSVSRGPSRRVTEYGAASRRFVQPGARDDRCHDGAAEPLDLQGDLVARLQVAPEGVLPDLEQAAAADGPAAEELARSQAHVGRRAGDHLPERVLGARPRPARGLDRPAVVRPDRRHHREVRPRRAGRRRSASSSGVTSHGPIETPKSLPFAGPSRSVLSSRWRSRADQSLSDEVAADRLLAALVGEVDRRRVDERPDLELVVQLDGPARRPDRVARARAARTRWRSRRSAGGTTPRGSPGRGAPTSSGRGARTRRSRGTRAGGGSGGRRPGRRRRGRHRRHRRGGEAVDEVRQRRDAQAAAEVVVERGHRLAVEHAVVGEVGFGRDRPATRDLEVDPAEPPESSAAARRQSAPAAALCSRMWARRIARV